MNNGSWVLSGLLVAGRFIWPQCRQGAAALGCESSNPVGYNKQHSHNDALFSIVLKHDRFLDIASGPRSKIFNNVLLHFDQWRIKIHNFMSVAVSV